MTEFNFNDYQYLADNQILKIKLRDQEQWLLVKSASKSVLQPFQTDFTPITKINLDIIKDLGRYKQDKDDEDNFHTIMVEPEDVVQFEVVEI